MSQDSIEAVQKWSRPNDSKEVLKFLGLVNYHRQFIPNFSRLTEPLYRISGTKTYCWTQEQEESFKSLKKMLVCPPVLSVPTCGDKFILDTDASDKAIAAELIQVQGGQERVIAYGFQCNGVTVQHGKSSWPLSGLRVSLGFICWVESLGSGQIMLV